MLVEVDDPVTGPLAARRQPDEAVGLRRPDDSRPGTRPRRRPRQHPARIGAVNLTPSPSPKTSSRRRRDPSVSIAVAEPGPAFAGVTTFDIRPHPDRRAVAAPDARWRRVSVPALVVAAGRWADRGRGDCRPGDDRPRRRRGAADQRRQRRRRRFRPRLSRMPRTGCSRWRRCGATAPAGLPKSSGNAPSAIDRQMRVFGLYRLAEAGIAAAVAGNAAAASTLMPPGSTPFSRHAAAHCRPNSCCCGSRPEPWRPADSLVWGKLMDLELAGNYRSELVRARLARTLSAEQLAFLYPEYPKEAPTTLAALAEIYRRLPLDPLYAALPPLSVIGPIYASNNWVVDGAHSESGKPLLANDPHLGFAAPGTWYLARLKTPEREIAGATAPGVPLVVIGHNDRIAWGFTTTGGDVEDLFIEKIDPDDPGHYLTPDGRAAFATRQETIAVRGAEPVDLDRAQHAARAGAVRRLAGRDGRDGLRAGIAGDVSRRRRPHPRGAVGHQPRRRLERLSQGAEKFIAPQQNMVYADTGGTIGFIAPARIPIRRNGNGWLPMPGWTGEYDWTGFVPFAELPQAQQPGQRAFRQRQQQDRPESLSLFPVPRLGHPQSRRADRGDARGDAAAIAGGEHRDAGRHGVARRPPAGAADDPHRAGRRRLARGDRAAAGLGFPDGRRQGRAAAVYRLAARICPRRVFRPARRCGGRLLGLAAAGHRSGADRTSGMVRRPRRASAQGTGRARAATCCWRPRWTRRSPGCAATTARK